MVLYLGNMLSKHGRSASMMEALIPKFSEEMKVKGFSDHNNKLLRLLSMLWAVLRFRKTTKIVLIDSFSTTAFYYTVAIAWLCRCLKIPYAPILHGGNFPQRLKSSPKLSAYVFNSSTTNISPSRYLQEHFELAGFVTSYIPNFLPIENYSFSHREKFRPRILWVRAFHSIYNPKLAVKILFELLKIYPGAELCMVGPDKDGSMASVKALAQNLGVSPKLKLTGKLSKKEWIILSEEYDIFINTTNFDNMPISVLEAMALGLPVISTDVGGLPYFIKNKENGMLVEPNDEHSFVSEIDNIITHPDFSNRLATTGRKFAETLSWEVIKLKWMEFFKRYG